MLKVTSTNDEKTEQLTEKQQEYRKLKLQFNNILQCTKKYCGICFDTEKTFYNLDHTVNIAHWEGDCATTIKAILCEFFNGECTDFMLGSNVCEECSYNAINGYIFMYKSKRASDIINDYIQQMNDRIDEISRVFQTSDAVQYANTFLVIHDPTDAPKDFGLVEKEVITAKEIINNVEKSPKKNDEGKLVCDHCHKMFATKKGLSYHILLHNDIKEETHATRKHRSRFACPECPEIVCRHHKYLMAYKDQKLAGQQKIKCPDCDYVCWAKVRLTGHANKVHLKTLNFICEYCSKPLHSRQAHTLHVLSYHTKFHNCNNCQRKFKLEENLRRHKEKCLRVPRPYKCDKCNAAFSTSLKLKNHKEKHKKNYSCGLCTRDFALQSLLLRHQEEVHGTEAELSCKRRHYICSICHNKYTTMKEKKDHMKTHSADEKHKCLLCDLEFNSFEQYLSHTRSPKHMLKQNPKHKLKYKCQECDYSTCASDMLEGHMNAHHLKIAPYECPECKRKMTSARSLHNHLKLHRDVKTQICDICGDHFRGKTSLRMHMRRRHTGERPYPCDYCEERFVNASMRQSHTLKKHCDKTIKCPMCEMMFHTIADMRIHFKKMHWKFKGEKFDYKRVKGLKEEDYELFRDRRLIAFTCE